MTVAEWLNNNAEQIGIDITTNEDLKKITTATANLNLPAEFEGKFLTRKAAENDPQLKSHFFAQALNGIDSTLKETLKELGIDEETSKALLLEKNTPKNVASALKKIQELEVAKRAAHKDDKPELQIEINKLKKDLSELALAKDSEINQVKNSYEQKFIDSEIKQLLSSYNFGTDSEAKSKGMVLARHFLTQAIAEKGLKIVQTDTGLVLKTKDDTDYYDNNKPVTFKSFADGIVSANKLITVTDDKSGSKPNNTGAKPNTIETNEDPLKVSGHSEFQQAREAYRTADSQKATV